MRALRLIVLIVLAVGTGVGGWYLATGPFFRLQSVDVVLDPGSHESFLFEKIQTSLNASLMHFTGLPFWKVPLDNVMSEVRSDRRVRTARIQREFPYHLHVIVVPQEPLIAYMDERGRVYPIARDGTLMPALSLKDIPNFPLLRGKEFSTDNSLREHAIQLMESIPTEGRFARPMVSEILHSPKDGFSLYLAGQIAEVKMGDDEFELKAGRVEKVLSYLHNRGLKGRIIDARFSKKVVVRVRGESNSKQLN